MYCWFSQISINQEHFFPCWANTTARLAAVVDFPSPGQADVIMTDFICRSTEANSIFVRIVRYCSEFKDFGSVIAMTFLCIREPLFFLSAKMSTPRFSDWKPCKVFAVFCSFAMVETVPKTGMSSKDSSCSSDLIVLSKCSSRKASPMLPANPAANAMAMLVAALAIQGTGVLKPRLLTEC